MSSCKWQENKSGVGKNLLTVWFESSRGKIYLKVLEKAVTVLCTSQVPPKKVM